MLPQLEKSHLECLIEGSFSAVGGTFFYSLVRELAQFLGTESVLLATCEDKDQSVYQTLAHWCDGSYTTNQAISLMNGPCVDIRKLYCLESSATELFPDSSLLNCFFVASGFFATKLLGSSGEPVGLLAGMHRSALHLDKNEINIIKLCSARAAAEIEREFVLSKAIAEKERAQAALHSMGDGVISTDRFGCVDYMNPVAETLTGWRHHQVMGLSLEVIFHLEDERTGQVIPDPAKHCLSEKRVVTPKTDNVLISRNGHRYSIQGTAAPVMSWRGDCTGVILVFKDVTDSYRLQKEIVHQATHDPLTGLVNRSEFEERLSKSLHSAKAFENTHSLLYLDLDRFKAVNDDAGHVAGDELLKQVCTLLGGQLRNRDTLGRLGGDEFSVLLENCPLGEASRVANILINVIREYRFYWGRKTYQIGVSIGIVPITNDSAGIAELMIRADNACYSAKRLGRGRVHIYDQNDARLAMHDSEILQVADLRDAIAKERFQLLYQPIISLDAERMRMQTRAEVLIRLIDQSGVYVLPGAFMPVADRFGLTRQIDRWVIGKVFNDYGHLFTQNQNLVLHLNLSDTSIADESLGDFIIGMFEKTVVSPNQICFEVKETWLNNNLSGISQLIDRLRDIGCSFALDGFGSGLSNFSFLKNLKVDFIKLSGNIVSDISEDRIDCAAVQSINTMAHLLGIETIAEHVESRAIIQSLKLLGVDYAQGHYLGNPAPMEDFSNTEPDKRKVSGAPVN